MKKIILMFFFVFSFGEIVTDKSIQVLNDLNIETDFIQNQKLQDLYLDYSKKKKIYFLNILENGYRYLPLIKQTILKYNVPKELISVAMAESYLTTSAKSHKRAIGLWQFMPKTAKKYGLRIDEYVDERKDPIKSTKAAVEYLSYLYRFFGKWYLSIMAYNAGEARIVEAVVRAKVDKLCKSMGDVECKKNSSMKEFREIIRNYQRHGRYAFAKLFKLYKKLSTIPVTLNDLLRFQKGLNRQYVPNETRNYILKIIAMSFLLTSDDFIQYTNMYLLNSGVTSELKKVNVPAGTSLYYVSKILNMPYEELREYNLHLKYSFTPPYKYYIYIPYDKLAEFRIKFHPKSFFYVYRVKKGDTLIKIARKYNVSVRMLKDFNKVGRYLRRGQKIIVPLSSVYVTYKVKKGDTLRKIAREFGIDYKKIKKANALKNSNIRVGQILKLPKELR